jgi:hypothetical protein
MTLEESFDDLLVVRAVEAVGEPGSILSERAQQIEVGGPPPNHPALVVFNGGQEVTGRVTQLVVSRLRLQGQGAGGTFPIFGREIARRDFYRAHGLHAEPAFEPPCQGIADVEPIESVKDLLFRAAVQMDTTPGMLDGTR